MRQDACPALTSSRHGPKVRQCQIAPRNCANDARPPISGLGWSVDVDVITSGGVALRRVAAVKRSIQLAVSHPLIPPGRIQGFRFMWAYYVNGYKPEFHCQKCFV